MQNRKYHPNSTLAHTHCEINQIDEIFPLSRSLPSYANCMKIRSTQSYATMNRRTVEIEIESNSVWLICYGWQMGNRKQQQNEEKENHNTSLMSTSRLTKSLYFMKIFRPSKRKILLPFANAYTQRQQSAYFVHETPNGLGVQHMCSCSCVDL